jgi:uncharacterized protein (DUF169 family)
MLPHTIATKSSMTSLGCIGNRIYTGLDDNELYLAVPGEAIGSVLDALATILSANVELERFHRQRAEALA